MKMYLIPEALAIATIFCCAYAASDPSKGTCMLPPLPTNGNYKVNGVENPEPSKAYEYLVLNYTCNQGYGALGDRMLLCIDGTWSSKEPKCVRTCKLRKNPSVEYKCLSEGAGLRACGESEPDGTIVQPQCSSPNYYSPGVLQYMRCIDGSWDYVATCLPECGTPAPASDLLLLRRRRSTPVRRAELPWHATVYKKTSKPYQAICGGTLVSNNVVISAAHCFWDHLTDKPLEAKDFAVAVGKLYRPWDAPEDDYAQKSDVSEIKIPSRFQGIKANLQEDISVLILATDVTFNVNVRPVCLSFDVVFEKRQLQANALGKIAAWSPIGPNGSPSKELQALQMPYVSIEQCLTSSPVDFREYITSDKICAGSKTGPSLCRGNSGSGLSFPEQERGKIRYYLRGVASTAPRVECNENSTNEYTLFTQISKHEHFIKEYL